MEYCLNNLGYNFKLAHLYLSDEILEIIDGKLAKGIEPNNIMDQIRRTIHTRVNRDSLVTTKCENPFFFPF